MYIVELIDGAFEIRWTWLPFWIAMNPKLKMQLEGEMKTIVALNGVTDSSEDLEKMHRHVVRRLCEMFPEFDGLSSYLNALQLVRMI
jgi:hypothetical protein